jgi:KDO2-lipid IV(A) lauroyltransferase
MLWLPGQSMENVDLRSACEGLEIVDRLEQEQRGAIIVSGHMGPIEFLIQSVASLGYNVFAIFEHLDNERLLAYIMELRTTHGLEIMSTRGPLLDAYRRIKKGAILLSAMDRDSTNTGLIVDFFGAPAWMPEGYARLAVRADVPVIFGYGRYTENGAGAKIFPPIYPDQTLGKELAVRQIVQQTVQLLEEVIRKDPGAWHLSTPVWKLVPGRQELGSSL